MMTYMLCIKLCQSSVDYLGMFYPFIYGSGAALCVKDDGLNGIIRDSQCLVRVHRNFMAGLAVVLMVVHPMFISFTCSVYFTSGLN